MDPIIVQHGPLEVKDAFKVTYTIGKDQGALDDLHGHGYTHNDVHFPNI